MNILKMASSILPMQGIEYIPYSSRTINDVGLEVTTYGTKQILRANVQAVSRSTYEALGLDFQKKYITVFIEKDLLDLNRGVSGDKLIFNGENYQVESETDWMSQDGWTYLTAVKVD